MNQSRLVIINPAAARARRAWPMIQAALLESGLDFDAYETRFAGDATTKTREALRAGYKTIAVVGGDGTLSEAAAGFFEFDEEERGTLSLPSSINAQAALAILPAGTGDDFARGLAGRREPLQSWLKRLITRERRSDSGMTRMVDVIAGRAAIENEREREFVCLNVSTIGLGAEVAVRVGRQGRFVQRLPGEARFLKAACTALLMWRERRLRIKVDEREPIECASNLIAVANNIYAGGGMMFAPQASTDDGLIDLMLSCNLTRRAILRELPRIHKGGHVNNPKVSLFKAKRVRLEPINAADSLPIEADGNPRGHTPAEFQIMPRALRIVF